MDSTPTVTEPPSGAPLGSPETGVDRSLRTKLSVLFAAVAIASAFRHWQYLLFMPIPLVLIQFSPRVTTRVLLFYVAVLVGLGGLVTTYRAGMAVPQYPGSFQDSMFEYPLGEMIAAGWGVTLEHTHRLWASSLGLVAIAVVLSTFIHRSPRSLKIMAGATLAAISVQGIIGGTRVLEVSTNLAFLHGTIAQAVVAMIAVLTVMASRAWRETRRTPSEFARGAYVLGPLVVGLLYSQLALGAWLRHHEQVAALLLHGTYALVIVAMVLVLAKQLGVAAAEGRERGIPRRPLGVLQGLLIGALVAQFVLGALATWAIFGDSWGEAKVVDAYEAVFATGHVLVGSLLFSSTVVGAVWARRALAEPAREAATGSASAARSEADPGGAVA